MQAFHEFISFLNGYLWGAPMLVALFGTHLFLTYRLKFIQRYTLTALKLSVSKDKSGAGDVSQFGALTTALAATTGTGNIVGVAIAVGLGGPGAVLWCWLTGVFGMATKYAEALLSVKYRVRTADGTMLGGPMYALEKGLGYKWLAVLFCIFTAFAAFGIGNTVQANAIASMVQGTFNISPHITGSFMAAITALVILGGVKSIARACELLVPFMALFYVLGCVVILMMNASYLGPAVALIVKSAFTPQAAGGGFVGASVMMALRHGIARGLFSNESGLGSAPIVAAAAITRNPVRQALVSMTGTFWDTVVVCLLTGLVIVSSVLRDPVGLGQLTESALTKGAFAQIPTIGPLVLTIGLLTFVFSAILGWSYYGERAVEYLLGKRAILPYRILWVLAVYVGSTTSLKLVWNMADAMNAMMAIPNLISLVLLHKVIVSETKTFLWDGGLELESTEEVRTVALD